MLDHVNTWMDSDEVAEEKTLELCYEIFRNIFTLGLFPALWDSLVNPDEFLTPHQTVLLKLLDAELQLPDRLQTHDTAYAAFLAPLCTQVSTYALASIQVSEKESVSVDGNLARIIEADILVMQCLTTLLLSDADSEEGKERLKLVKEAGEEDMPSVVDISVDLLKRLDLLIPRIILGQARFSTGAKVENTSDTDPAGFAYIKRDIVRLLGILCHDDRQVQDSIRERDGIRVVMNMCVTDERSPYLREHALFALRNLLHRNAENQAVVDAFKPIVKWDAEGNLAV